MGQAFLELLENDPGTLAEMTHAQLATLGGFEGAEVIMHLVMRGAMSANVRKIHQGYYLPSMTGIGVAVYENDAVEPPVDVYDEYRRHIGHQLDGIEKLSGTYPFTLERSVAAYRINKFLHCLIEPANRAAFLADPETAFASAGLTEHEREMIRGRDWREMIHYGVSFFMLEKLGAVVGVSNLHIYAAMRGESFEEFQKSRNTKIIYSTA